MFKVDFDLVEPRIVIGSSDLEGLKLLLEELPNTVFTDAQKQELTNCINDRIRFINEYNAINERIEKVRNEINHTQFEEDVPMRIIGFHI
jgi:hypothetical protein